MKTFKTVIIALLALSFPVFSNAQLYNFRTFSIEEGLAQSGVYAIFEDSKGNLWFATEGGGVSKYDGRTFTTLSKQDGLCSNNIRDITEDHNGHLWFATSDNGLCRYDGAAFMHFDSIPTEDGVMIASHVRAIVEDDKGQLWAGTYGDGVIKILPGRKDEAPKFGHYTKEDGLGDNVVRDIGFDLEGNIWFGTDKGATRYDGEVFRNYNKQDGMIHHKVLDVYRDREGDMWFGTTNGVCRLSNGRFVNLTTDNGLIHNRVKGILHDRHGYYWFGTRIGVSRISAESLNEGQPRFKYFTEANGLSSNRIRTIIQDASGSIWFGTYFGGASQFLSDRFVHYDAEHGMEGKIITAVANCSKGGLWLGTYDGGIHYFDEKEFHTVHFQNMSMIVQTLHEDTEGNLWIGTNDIGLIQYQPEGEHLTDGTYKIYNYEENLSNPNVYAIMNDPKGGLWVGTHDGITHIHKGAKGAFVLTQVMDEEGITKNDIYDLAIDQQGTLWAGTNGGLLEIPGNQDSLHTMKATLLKAPDWKEDDIFVQCVTLDKNGSVWIGTRENGVFHYTPNQAQPFQPLSNYHSQFINSLIFDDHDHLWVGTIKGLEKVQFEEDGSVLRNTQFDSEMGFTGIQVNLNAVCKEEENGHLWFGTINGVTRYAPEHDILNEEPPSTHITQVQIDFKVPDWAKDYDAEVNPISQLPHDLSMPYQESRISFKFNGINMIQPGKVRYQFKLNGYDEDWSPVSDKNEITYSNLPPNQYNFLVKASNGNGVWNEYPASFLFTITPRFWQTPAFWIAVILVLGILIGASVWVYTRNKTKILQEQKDKLEIDFSKQTKALHEEKEKANNLLLSILPEEIAEELKKNEFAKTRNYDVVSVLFSDYKGFTNLSESMEPDRLVFELDAFIKEFDSYNEKFHIEKIKTIGDSYMCAGGIPVPNEHHPIDTVLFGMAMIDFMNEINDDKRDQGLPTWDIRVGVHTGPLIAGVVGLKKFAYDIWGDTVNIASRMESSGETGKLNISGATYELVKDYFECSYRGKIAAKNKGELDMYFVDRIKPEYAADPLGKKPDMDWYLGLRKQQQGGGVVPA